MSWVLSGEVIGEGWKELAVVVAEEALTAETGTEGVLEEVVAGTKLVWTWLGLESRAKELWEDCEGDDLGGILVEEAAAAEDEVCAVVAAVVVEAGVGAGAGVGAEAEAGAGAAPRGGPEQEVDDIALSAFQELGPVPQFSPMMQPCPLTAAGR